MQANMQAEKEVKELLKFCSIPKTRSEMQEFMKHSDRENIRKNLLTPLIKGGGDVFRTMIPLLIP